MRWFVDISSIGASGGKASRFCVEAEQWQRALQSVRALRGDVSPFSNFSIELLEEGYRAIDPATRTRYVVVKAPDDAELTTKPIEVPSLTSSPPPSLRPSRRPRAQVAIPDDPVPRAPQVPSIPSSGALPDGSTRGQGGTQLIPAGAGTVPLAAVSAAPPARVESNGSNPSTSAPSNAPIPGTPVARPMQAETAFERMTEGLAAFPLAAKSNGDAAGSPPGADGSSVSSQPRSQDVSTEVLPRFRIIAERAESPTASSPLNYREMVFAVAESTSYEDAGAIVRAQFEVVRASLHAAPKGQFITLAVFDHEFDGKPRRLPLATLSFKDWRDSEPQIRFPLRDVRTSTNAPASSPMRNADAEMESAPETQVNPRIDIPLDARRSDDALPKVEIQAPEHAGPSPTPSDIARAAVEMGKDDDTLVKRAANLDGAAEIDVVVGEAEEPEPPTAARPVVPPPPDSLTQVMPPPKVPSDFAAVVAHVASADDAASEAPTPAMTTRLAATALNLPDGGAPATDAPVAPPAVAPTTTQVMPASSPPPAPDGGFNPTARGSFHSVPPGAAPAPVATVALPASQPPPPPPPVEPARGAPSAPPPSVPPPTFAPPTFAPRSIASIPPVSAKPRVRDDDLISELFDALSDLQFLADPLEGADFVLAVALENLPSELGFISFFSLDSREFVVVRTNAEAPPGLALSRSSERARLATRAMHAHQAVVLTEGAGEAIADDARWQASGIVPTSLICAPVNLGGRYMGLIELANPLDGIPYSAADGNAMSYISGQFAEFLGQRELVLDPHRISAPPLHARVRRVE